MASTTQSRPSDAFHQQMAAADSTKLQESVSDLRKVREHELESLRRAKSDSGELVTYRY